MINNEKIDNLKWLIISEGRIKDDNYILQKYEQEILMLNNPSLSLWFISFFDTKNLPDHIEIIINSSNKDLINKYVEIVNIIKDDKRKTRKLV
ncbi:MAG: hypothetical protein PUC23_00055 [bacterium]|nr:hypothetical protein [bacterium]